LDGSSTNLLIRIIVPKQYSTAEFSFRDALDVTAGFKSSNLRANLYWEIDEKSDPCNVIYTASIPWSACRGGACGLHEDRYSDAVCFKTDIDVEVTKRLVVTPHTLEANGLEHELMMKDDGSQTHTRIVRLTIPLQVCFDLKVKVWANANVVSDHLRVASAVVDSSVLDVDVDHYPMATAQVEVVTVIPLPIYLTHASINVSDPSLADGLTIDEIPSKRDCDYEVGFCTQHWHIGINAKKCTLNGRYIATVTGACHPHAHNCVEPYPSKDSIVMDITSDDYCGVSQEIEIHGNIQLKETKCNGYMEGTVSVENSEGARVNRTRILKLRTEPKLDDSKFMTVYDYNGGSNAIEHLEYHATEMKSNEIKFRFKWSGAHLRCDVRAHLEVMVQVEFEASRPLLLSMSTAGSEMLDDSDMIDETMRMIATSGYIAADDGTTDGPDGDGGANPDGESAAVAWTPSVTMAVVVGLLAAALRW
jgi:hypothetical protein